MNLFQQFADVFGGGGGSQSQASDPGIGGAGDGPKHRRITDYLNGIVGAYDAITGAGTKAGPAPMPQAPTRTGQNSTLWIVGGLVVVVLLFFVFKRR